MTDGTPTPPRPSPPATAAAETARDPREGDRSPAPADGGAGDDAERSGREGSREGWIDRLLARVGLRSRETTRADLEDLLALTAENPGISTHERAMLRNVLRFHRMRVYDVMVPRADIVAVAHETSLGEMLRVFRTAGHSRLPVYGETLDDPKGMVHIRDFLDYLVARAENGGPRRRKAKEPGRPTPADGVADGAKPAKASGGRAPSAKAAASAPDARVSGRAEPRAGAERAGSDKAGNGRSGEGRSGEGKPAAAKALDAVSLSNIDLSATLASARILRPVLFAPPSMPAVELLVRMQTTRTHMALVIDEYGGTDGLVSIEDLVEMVVGDIEDEHDLASQAMIRESGADTWVADARADLEEASRVIGYDFTEAEVAEDVDTLGGLIVALAGRVPARAELIAGPESFEFEVLDADPRRLKRVRVHRRDPSLRLVPAGVATGIAGRRGGARSGDEGEGPSPERESRATPEPAPAPEPEPAPEPASGEQRPSGAEAPVETERRQPPA
ncbi:hemolysin family protein [Salinarimonas rosea]|uniref:hemolysin family protein n=1 Tax=Salinarimonas rosea TaxID=552063 RepID=UPI0004184E25|nr:hemolysin family protein [Salinarimonas rosea]